MNISVAIDGPAGAGKSTIAKILSKKFNLMYINTGAMYRAVTLVAMSKDISYKDVDNLLLAMESMEMHFENDNLILNGRDVQSLLNTPLISKNVSNYAQVPEVRSKLVKLQREMGYQYNVIMDGRDIGTVVLKNATFKFFLTASPEERANRRFEELKNKGLDVIYNDVLNDIIKRDYIDSNRETDPLRKASDAIEVDTTGLDINGVVNKISDYINNGLK